ncbi:MAG: phosphomevalonate kinase [Candidatus Micrarchaeota archaeon]|nr:MAG: phosphomevalonate kinase [Candidatus Micrarchaeota archaeon]
MIVAKAPGKILWLGGYAVLERPNIGFVTTVKEFVNVSLDASDRFEISFRALDDKISFKSIYDLDLSSIDPRYRIATSSVITACSYLDSLGIRVTPFKIDSHNDKGFGYIADRKGKIVRKTGLGASAAATVAIIAAIMYSYNIKDIETIHKLAQIAHSIANGKIGSGFDVAAATYGSIVYTRFTPDLLKDIKEDNVRERVADLVSKRWDYKIKRLSLSKIFRVALIMNKRGYSDTNDLVSKVFEFKKANSSLYNEIISLIDYYDRRAIRALSHIESNKTRFKYAFTAARLLTKLLGREAGVDIEDDKTTALIESLEENGAFVARVPGAGGKDAIAALSISKSDYNRLKLFAKKKHLDLIELESYSKGFYVKY